MSKNKLTVLVNPNVNNSAYIDFLSKCFDVTVVKYSNNINVKIDLILFTGGEDVTPKLYNERTGKYTRYNTERDILEKSMYYDFNNVPKLGICRGAQFLTVMNGGKLIQHVENHSSKHLITLSRNLDFFIDNLEVTSTHHQMMYPFNLKKEEYDILAYSTNYLSDKYLDGNDLNIKINKDFYECEIVRYNKSKSLCIQGHPEFNGASKEFKDLTFYLINRILQ